MSAPVAELVERALRGDAPALEELVRLHLGAAHAVALAVLRDPHEAEDVVQDAFATALKRLKECREPARFPGWLLRIVRNHAKNHRRYLTVRAAAPLDVAESHPSGHAPAQDAERAEIRERLAEAVGELPEVQREVVLLHDLEGWKHREIAEAMGIPDGTVRYHLFNARKVLRARLSALVHHTE